MWTSVIIDDERKSRETLQKIIERYFNDQISIVYSAASVEEGAYAIKRFDPRLVFLDIEMPEENYSKIITNKNEEITVPKTLKNLEYMLPEMMFFRIHKSYIVNLNYIKSYTKMNGYKITLENGVRLNVATRRNDEFLKALTRQNSNKE